MTRWRTSARRSTASLTSRSDSRSSVAFRLWVDTSSAFLTKRARPIVILSHYGDERSPPQDRYHHQRPAWGRLLPPLSTRGRGGGGRRGGAAGRHGVSARA